MSFKYLIPSSIVFKCGTQTRVRYISITSIVQAIGQNLCSSLLGMHAYTGCDTVSAFAGRGKIGALWIVKEQRYFQEMFDLLGVEWEFSDNLFQMLQNFTCRMYSSRPGTNSINELRYRFFCSKRCNIESDQLPPCPKTWVKTWVKTYVCTFIRHCWKLSDVTSSRDKPYKTTHLTWLSYIKIN